MSETASGALSADSLVTETVLAAAVRAFPGDVIAGHAPQVLMHARLADQKAATATPAEGVPMRLITEPLT